MNYLAHLYLSCDNEDLLIGNFIADSISNKDLPNYSDAIQEGIRIHRLIDSYTDSHVQVKRGTKRLHAHHHKYAPVVVDILYDHILARNWARYSGQTLPEFAKYVYEILERRFDDMPSKMQKRLPKMIEANWLLSYGELDGLRFTFKKMDERTSFPSNFVSAVEHVQEDYSLFEEEFNAFFPEVISYVKANCKC